MMNYEEETAKDLPAPIDGLQFMAGDDVDAQWAMTYILNGDPIPLGGIAFVAVGSVQTIIMVKFVGINEDGLILGFKRTTEKEAKELIEKWDHERKSSAN